MKRFAIYQKKPARFVFWAIFVACTVIGATIALAQTAHAAPAAQTGGYAGADSCKQCHENLYTTWQNTRHAHAFSSPIFQRDWSKEGSLSSCLECHTTGYDPLTGQSAQEGVTCEACHGPFQSGHPEAPMPITPNADLCGTCHKNTTDEWRASAHGQKGIQCEACHNPHSQTAMAASITELCSNCHKERGSSFTHGTHANAGLECSNCHMFTKPRMEDPIMGLVPTGHTFSVGSDACIGCHQDTVHTRDVIIKLSSSITQTQVTDINALQQKITEQDQKIASLEATNTIRLYTGLAQGAIVGLITGGAAAWVVSRRIRLVEVDENG